MKFYDRKKEIVFLQNTLKKSQKSAQFTILTGRRRIGKTSLVLKAYEKETMLYFFVARKSESDLCESFVAEIENVLNIPILGKVKTFAELFEFLMKLSIERHFTLFIDEFQEFSKVNKSIFSEMQRVWDLYEKQSKINLIVCSSVYSMMQKIFTNSKEPLYGRCTGQLKLRAFSPSVLKEILNDANPKYTNEDLLALYSFTGGVAKYVQLLLDAGATTKEKMIRYIISPNSIFVNDGKNTLVEDFGRDYGKYFSILTCIAQGHNTRSDIEAILDTEIGGYLTNLEKDYELIKKHQPIFENTSSRNIRYQIKDVFFTFWFRFIFKYNHIVEIENYAKLQDIVNRDYETFSGFMLERYFYDKAVEMEKYTNIGQWWDRKGFNELDLIVADETQKTIEFFEIKRNASRFDIDLLNKKVEVFLQKNTNLNKYKIQKNLLSMKDM